MRALVTGATAGIGLSIAEGLVRQGASVVITGRDEQRGAAAAQALNALAGREAAEFVACDASRVADNEKLASWVLGHAERLDVLVNNAGGAGWAAKRTLTDEGLEAVLALNFVGPVALTTRLVPLLRASPQPRIVNVVTAAKWAADIAWRKGDNPFDDPQSLKRYVYIEAHAKAKALNILWTLALAGELRNAGLAINPVNPGMAWTPNTQALTPEAVPAWRFMWPLIRWFQRRAPAGKAAEGPLFLASSTAATFTGRYYEGLQEKSVPSRLGDPTSQQRAMQLAIDLIASTVS